MGETHTNITLIFRNSLKNTCVPSHPLFFTHLRQNTRQITLTYGKLRA